jgi:hypothetical protein
MPWSQHQAAAAAEADSDKILLLFDLNGVLTEKTPARQEGRCVCG